jgi:hypothetical protein
MGRKSSLNKVKRSNSASKNIEASLCMYLYEKSHSPVSTHFSGYGLQECDVISISKSDYIYEYEVKISRSDFKNDFKKLKHKNMVLRNAVFEVKKTGEINYNIPNYFSFVVPKDLIKLEEIPEYAGLIYLSDDNMSFEIIKKAPLLHNTKATTQFIRKLSHNLTCKLIFGTSDISKNIKTN